MNISELNSELPMLINLTIAYLINEKGIALSNIADDNSRYRPNLIISMVSKMARNNSLYSKSEQRKFLIHLLKKHDVSIFKDNDGNFSIQKGKDESFYMPKFTAFLYDKDTELTSKFIVVFDIIGQTLYFYDENNILYVSGQYSFFSDLTKYSSESETNIYYSNNYKKTEDERTHVQIDMVFNGIVPDTIREPVMGYYTKRININKLSTGRVVISKNSQLNQENICYLTNDTFHKFIKYNTHIESQKKLRDLVRGFNEKYRFLHMKVPKELATAYQQFLSFFADYVDIIKGKAVIFDILKKSDGLSINIELRSDELSMNELKVYLDEYISFTEENVDNLKLKVESDIRPKEFDIFVLDLKVQINHFKQSLDLANLKNKLLEQQYSDMKELLHKALDRNPQFHVQLINGGNQQFSDEINNQI